MRGLLIKGLLLLAVVAGCAVLVARLAGGPAGLAPLTGAPQDRLGPVLLVPGYGGSTSALEGLAGALRATGRDAQVVDLLGDGTGDLRVAAQALAAAADGELAAGESAAGRPGRG